MQHKTLKTVLCVIVGICIFSMLSAVFTMIADFVMYDYLIENELANLTLLTDVKWASLTVGFLIIPTLVSYVLSFVEKGKSFKITASVLSFVTFVAAIVFLDIIRKDAEYLGGSGYASGIAYVPEMMQVAIPCFIMGIISIAAVILPIVHSGRRHKETENDGNIKDAAKEEQHEENL